MTRLVNVVWYDGFRREREKCTLVNETEETITFKDAEDVEFTINKELQLIKMENA